MTTRPSGAAPTGVGAGSRPGTGAAAAGVTPTASTGSTDADASDADTGDEVPDWRSLLKAMAPPPGPAQEVAETGSIPVVTVEDPAEAEPEEVPERIRRPLPFTWLQWVILVVVFFVLGFLIVLVGKTATGAEGTLAPTLAAAAA